MWWLARGKEWFDAHMSAATGRGFAAKPCLVGSFLDDAEPID